MIFKSDLDNAFLLDFQDEDIHRTVFEWLITVFPRHSTYIRNIENTIYTELIFDNEDDAVMFKLKFS